ncbi:hypothetical protein [Halobacterium salinarum]|uniref:hypothetical protein n=1 Tax=Halobacterium salinarum TaxID=2242 RepID=UPI002552AEE4|nr:hypothetical protein [Halobacterium salinarum]MDL0126121.1 hypothetical protein [Halobacterium salinarum]MDL0145958.1 hypothetical protein [Halobacterium salinarum]
MSDNSDQLRFGDNGELEHSSEEQNSSDNLRDDGEPMGRFQTKGGHSIFPVSSLLQKSVRRSDEKAAAWAAWELVRSGYESMFWKRMLTIATEDISVENDVTTQVRTLYKLGTGQEDATSGWSGEEERGRVCAIRAALTCAQAESSRLSDYMNNTFERIADERVTAAEEGRAPAYDFPAGDLDPGSEYDVVFDTHTSQGSGMNRGYRHFLVHSSRTDSMADMEAWFKRINMELVAEADDTSAEFTDTEFNHALSTVDPDGPWEEPDFEQETLDSE